MAYSLVQQSLQAIKDIGRYFGVNRAYDFSSVVYQGVREFARRSSGDEVFINAMLMELLLRLVQPDRSAVYLEDLLQHITKAAMANFKLHRYVSSCKAHSAAHGSNMSGPVRNLYQCATSNEQGTPSQFLRNVAVQSSSLTVEQLREFTMPFLEQLLPTLDTSSNDAQQCVTTLVATFIIGFVQMEPRRPQNWTRLAEIPSKPCKRQDGSCNSCWNMDAFLQDGTVQSHGIVDGTQCHLKSR